MEKNWSYLYMTFIWLKPFFKDFKYTGNLFSHRGNTIITFNYIIWTILQDYTCSAFFPFLLNKVQQKMDRRVMLTDTDNVFLRVYLPLALFHTLGSSPVFYGIQNCWKSLCFGLLRKWKVLTKFRSWRKHQL